jgi:glutamate carboxypeptidase
MAVPYGAVMPWVTDSTERIAARAERELEALVAASSPSGDVHGAEEAAAVAAALAPDAAVVERPPCSSPGFAPDLLLRLRGTGRKRVLLLGHLDTVVAHQQHQALHRVRGDGERLQGSGSVDMKGGDVLALGVLRALAERTQDFAEVALLLVQDEEWRRVGFAHTERFAGWDACLCFEAGELDASGRDAVVVKRKAAGAIQVTATGRSAHSGSAPDKGVNALLALATAAQAVAACHDPGGPAHLTAVPTVIRAGEALNVVPGAGHLICDVRADDLDAVESVIAAVPAEVGGATLRTENLRRWPGMDSRAHVGGVLEAATEVLGRPVVGAQRGGASDASHFAATIPVTIDGLGPRGGGAHAAHEYVLASSLRTRAEVALAVTDAVLGL